MDSQTPKETLLFVDDEQSILEIAREFFEMKGYRVHTASNGREALEVLERKAIDCCFTDINMPEMDGLQLAEHINSSDTTIPVIIMTGYPSLDTAIRTIKNGVVDFLIKPVNLNQMELCLRRVFMQRRLFVQNLLLQREVEGKKRLEQLNRQLEEKVSELNTLNRIMRDITAIRTSTDVFSRMADMAVEITPADIAVFYLLSESMQRPFAVALSRTGDSRCEHGFARDDQPLIEKLIMDTVDDQTPLLAPAGPGTNGVPPGLQSLVVVPLKIREKGFGALVAAVSEGAASLGERDLYYLSFMTHNAGYAVENMALYENIYENLFSTLYAFVTAIEARDSYTRQHSQRVTRIAVEIGRAMGCSREDLDILSTAGHLHDIGKIGIRDEILLKPGPLTEQEYDIIKKHPQIGADIVGHLGLWAREQEIIRCHHERYDGKGYPDGLAGEQIPLLARILAVADVYDSLASDRAYRKRMQESRIIAILKESSGRHFDPRVMAAFWRVYDSGRIFEVLEEAPK